MNSLDSTEMILNQNAIDNNDEIDLLGLLLGIWRGRWLVIGGTMLGALIAAFFAISLPNMYESQGLYVSAKKEGAANALAAQYGGLAAMAGVSLGDDSGSEIDQALALLNSWQFIDSVITKYEMAPLIAGVKGWSQESGLLWDSEVYNPQTQQWIENEGRLFSKGAPSSYQLYEMMRGMLTVSKDGSTGLISIAVEHYSPDIAAKWVSIFVNEVNAFFQNRDVQESRKNIAYLEKKIAETGISEMHSVFYGMIETQIRTLMLAEVGDEYLLKLVVKPKVAEVKSSPRRGLLVVLGGLAGCFIFIFIQFIRIVINTSGVRESIHVSK